MTQRLIKENRPVPDLLRKAADKSFYRESGGRLEQINLDGDFVPVKRAAGVLLLSDIKRAGKPVEKNVSASLWDIGDGVLCLEFHSKMNAIDAEIFTMIGKAIALIGDGTGAWKGLVVHNEAENFSVGANLSVMKTLIKENKYDVLENLIRQGQGAYSALRFAPFPSVAAPAGMVLGGGCEVTMHCSAVQAYCETFLGLVEPNVGLIPGWGGCTQMLCRAFDLPANLTAKIPPVSMAFESISGARISKSAAEARDFGLLRAADGVSMNKDRLLADAKKRVLELAKDYKPPQMRELVLPASAGRSALDLQIESLKQQDKVSPHDVTVFNALAVVLCGDAADISMPVSEKKLMDLERREFMRLARMPETLARIEHMLDKGKPLRN
jgi:3-hydroxyacyl-CoA dehydrogenase